MRFFGFRLLLLPGIRRYVLIPFAINLALFMIGFLLGYHLLTNWIETIEARWDWFVWLSWLLYPIFIFLCLIVVFFCFSLLANLIAAPFNSQLSLKVENILRDKPRQLPASTQALPTGFMSSLVGEGYKLLYILVRMIPLLCLFFIPGVQIIAPLLWLYFGAWMLAMEYLDYPLGNQGQDFNAQRQILQKNRLLLLGFGCGVTVLMLLPVINFLAMPTAVCAATRLSLEDLKIVNSDAMTAN